MHKDNKKLIHDIIQKVCALDPDLDLKTLSIQLEELISEYHFYRNPENFFENDLKEKVELFLSARKIEGLSSTTLKGYYIELGLFAKYINKAVTQITTSDIRNYLANNSAWKNSTVDRKLSVLRTFFSWLVKEEILLRDPTLRISPPKLPKRLPKSLTIQELEIVRESCENSRQRALIEVMYSTACRLSEIINMKINDVTIQEMSIRIIGKGDKERKVYLSDKAWYHLHKYLNSRNDNCEYLFVTERRPIRKMSGRNLERIVNIIEKRANVSKKLTPVVFRHTFATLAMQNGADLADIQQLLGHELPATTQIYVSIPEERKKQAHRRFHSQ